MGRIAGDFRAADHDPILLRKAGGAFAEVMSRGASAAGATSFAGRPLKGWRVRVVGDTAFIRPSNPGAVVALNTGTAPHLITPKRTRRRRNTGPKALAAAGFGPVASAQHPGTTGRRFVARSRPAAEEAAHRLVRRDLVGRVQRGLR
jgi:hypothetical protein